MKLKDIGWRCVLHSLLTFPYLVAVCGWAVAMTPSTIMRATAR